MKTRERDSAPAKKVFNGWKDDTSDVITNCMKHDWEKMLISRICPDHNELRKIKNELISNFAMLKEIFHYLQAKSKSYPKLELRVID